MKKLLSLMLAACLAATPAMALEVHDEADLRVVALCNNESIEVGDQFMVNIMLDGNFDKYLTYSVAGSFDYEMAELIAPVYKDDGFSIIWNVFSNEDGTFQFDAADIASIKGTDDPLICSLLFKAKQAGTFGLRLGHAAGENVKFFLGRAGIVDGKYDYDFQVDSFEVVIGDDSDNKDVVIIAEREAKTPYDDMYDHAWAEVSVGVLARLGVLDGIAEESFEPDKEITRGEFIAMLMRGAKINGEGEGFADVPDDYPFAKEIVAAKAIGVANGYDDGSFHPDDAVSRQDIGAFVFRALKYKQKMRGADISVLEGFSDSDEISDYAVEAMCGVVNARLISGDDRGKLKPLDNMTRAEAAVLIERTIIHIKLVR